MCRCDNSYFFGKQREDLRDGAASVGHFPSETSQRRPGLAPAQRQAASAGHRQTVVSFIHGPIGSDSKEAGRTAAARSQTREPSRGQSKWRQPVQILAAVAHVTALLWPRRRAHGDGPTAPLLLETQLMNHTTILLPV